MFFLVYPFGYMDFCHVSPSRFPQDGALVSPSLVCCFINPMNTIVISTIDHRIQPLISQLNLVINRGPYAVDSCDVPIDTSIFPWLFQPAMFHYRRVFCDNRPSFLHNRFRKGLLGGSLHHSLWFAPISNPNIPKSYIWFCHSSSSCTCPSFDQKSHDVEVPIVSCNQQGCCTIVICLIFGCTNFDQKSHDVEVPIVSCNQQGCCTIVICLIFGCTNFD